MVLPKASSDASKTEIRITKKENLTNYTLIEGFPGIGLVGTIASGYLVEKRKMRAIGYVYSDRFPPMTTIHKGKPHFPARIYKDPKGSFCVLLAEFVIPAIIVYDLSRSILDFANQYKLKQIVSLAGMTSPKPETQRKVYGIASNDEMSAYLKKKNVTLIKEGITTGVSGVLMAKCAIRNFPAVSLLAEAKRGYPDPRAAAAVLDKLNELVGIKVDTKELLKEATNIESKMNTLLKQLQKEKPYKTVEKAEESYPAMYE